MGRKEWEGVLSRGGFLVGSLVVVMAAVFLSWSESAGDGGGGGGIRWCL